ncbi:hypothetical protein PR202_gb23718 [Eleusine coracana subsp. coracana]|uniref:phenylalanine--tRNA ligase n=1 Tax=Eleusine coracana subsp. coracana TaxID=191504 RepID=A0AAV5FJ56_ELECO|nr:hypothetical protein PR202_gb23718 [Eleusine coracana subsp. coracana]
MCQYSTAYLKLQAVSLLNKMHLQAEICSSNGKTRISVSVPPTRSDILHARDLAEDIAIAYGYNNVPKSKPKCVTMGGRQPLNLFSDKIRAEVARAGYMEVLTFVLCSHEENFEMLNRTDDRSKTVIIANPRTSEFEVHFSQAYSLPWCSLFPYCFPDESSFESELIFEVGDVVTLNSSNEVGASNNRRLAALYCNRVSGFEEIMGLVDSIVKVVRADHVKFDKNYYAPTNEPEFFPKRQCKIVMKGGKEVGYLGVVHAEVHLSSYS